MTTLRPEGWESLARSLERRIRALEGARRLPSDLTGGLVISEAQVSGLEADLNSKAEAVHGHDETDVANLLADLAGLAPLAHTHTESDIANLLAELRRCAPPSRPANCVAQSWDPTTTPTTSGTLTSGTLFLQRVWLWAGVPVNTLTWRSSTTGMSGGTHAWSAVFDKNRNLLVQSADQTSPTWASSSLKAFTLSSAYTPSVSDEHYLGLLVAATTMPTLVVANSNGTAVADVQYPSGASSSGLAGTAPSTAASVAADQPALVYAS